MDIERFEKELRLINFYIIRDETAFLKKFIATEAEDLVDIQIGIRESTVYYNVDSEINEKIIKTRDLLECAKDLMEQYGKETDSSSD